MSTQSPTVRRNGAKLSVTLWSGEPSELTARAAALPTLAPGELLTLAGAQGRTFRYYVVSH